MPDQLKIESDIIQVTSDRISQIKIRLLFIYFDPFVSYNIE